MSEYIREPSEEEEKKLRKQAAQLFKEIAGFDGQHEGGTFGLLLQQVQDVLVAAKAQRLRSEEIASLPVTNWNLNDRRSFLNFALRDRREEAWRANEDRLAELPKNLYIETYDGNLPQFREDILGD